MFSENELNALPKRWQTHFKKMIEFENLSQDKWKPVHVLGYFNKKYRKENGCNFPFNMKHPTPGKSPDFYFLKQASFLIKANDNLDLISYIDFIFDTIVPKMKGTFYSLGLIVKPEIIANYNKFQQEKKKIYKTTPLPPEFLQIATTLEIDAAVYGDLAFIKKALAEDSESPSRQHYKKLLHTLYGLGLKSETLESL